MQRLLTAAIATSLMTSAMPAAAQTYRDDNARYSQDRGDYDRQMREYEANRSRYERDRASASRGSSAGATPRRLMPVSIFT